MQREHESVLSSRKGAVGGWKGATLTVHCHGDVLLHEFVPAADAAFVQAAV